MADARPQKGDILKAHMALALVAGTAAAVGSAILDHYNHKTGRCDPSVDRLAQLLGINGSTVRASTRALVRDGLFTKESHGGRFNTATYSPCWDRFREIMRDWNERMKSGAGPAALFSKRAKMRGSTAQKCAVDARRNALQTGRKNRTKEPSPVVPLARVADNLDSTDAPKGSKGLGKKESGPRRQGFLVHAWEGGRSVSHSTAVDAARERRLTKVIGDLPTKEEREAAWLAQMGARE